MWPLRPLGCLAVLHAPQGNIDERHQAPLGPQGAEEPVGVGPAQDPQYVPFLETQLVRLRGYVVAQSSHFTGRGGGGYVSLNFVYVACILYFLFASCIVFGLLTSPAEILVEYFFLLSMTLPGLFGVALLCCLKRWRGLVQSGRGRRS